MTESKTESHHTAASPRRAGRIRKAAIVTLVALAAGVGAAAWADGRHGGCGWQGGGPGMMWDGGPGMMSGAGGPGMMGGGPGMSDRMLNGLNATDAQRAQIRQIRQAAAADMQAQFEARRSLREKMTAIFTAPTVDAAAAEALRQQMLAQQEQTSKRMMQSMIEVANVLTPEQRSMLAERMKMREQQRHDRMQRRQPASAPRN